MSEYSPSFSLLGSFIEKTMHGLEHTLENYSEALSGFLTQLRLTTLIPSSLSDVVLSPASFIDPDLFLRIWETLAILNDKEFMQAIANGKEDIRKGRVHNFSELLAEYGLE